MRLMLIALDVFSIFLFSNQFSPSSQDLWIDCHPDFGASEQRCAARGCVWSPKSIPGAPYCQFDNSNDPSKMAGYDAIGRATGNYRLLKRKLKRRPTPTLFGGDFPVAFVKIDYVTDDILHILITDQNKTAHRALHPKWHHHLHGSGRRPEDAWRKALFEVQVQDSPFGFVIIRKDTGVPLFDTRRIPGFTFAQQYLQMSARVPTQYVYGLGEVTHQQLKHDFNYRQWAFYNKDHAPGFDTSNLYGFHPFYLCIDDDTGNSHGVFFLNTHALNVALQPDPSNPAGGVITWRSIGGAFEFFLLAGPRPADVIHQYTSIIGRPNMPPYWAMGYQLSRFGYKNVTNLEKVFQRNRQAGIPQDTQVIDADYMNKFMDYTTDPVAFGNLTQFVANLHNQYHMKLVLIVDPGIASQPNGTYAPLDRGLQLNVFVKDNRTGKPIEGKVWPGSTYFPDFSHPNTTAWWTSLIQDFYSKQGVKFDGLWIDMNEPSSFVDGSTSGCAENAYNSPPYNPLAYPKISEKTVCADADQFAGKHYELHNLYGYLEAKATYKALQTVFPGTRWFTLSRSTFAGSGKYTNHWTGDNRSLWPHMKMSIITMLEFNLFGIPMVGADICGFSGDATEEMCVRWHQLGAFYPFSRNHNDMLSKDQDPAAWSTNGIQAIKTALEYRYAFLPYLYTLLHQAHVNGTPVARPLFFDYPGDKATRVVDDQFTWGRGLMIAPTMEQGASKRPVYFPQGRWYDAVRFSEIPNPSAGRSVVMDTPLYADAPSGLYLRGGCIIPFQKGGVNTFETRQHPFWLLVALGENDQAGGILYWDDGESDEGAYSLLQFEAWQKDKIGGIKMKLVKTGFVVRPLLERVYVYGMQSKPAESPKLDESVIQSWDYKNDQHLLMVDVLHVDLNAPHAITWKFA